MTKSKLSVAAILLGLLSAQFCINAELALGDEPKPTIILTSTVGDVGDDVKIYFNVSINNGNDDNIRIIDIEKRKDVIGLWFDVRISPTDSGVSISRFINDPDIIYEDDFIILKSQETIEFRSIVLPIDYRELVPGKYWAFAVFTFDPLTRPGETYMSKPILFEIP